MNWIGLLGVILVIFKVLGIITLSWWWVTLPFWGGACVILCIAVFICLVSILHAWSMD